MKTLRKEIVFSVCCGCMMMACDKNDHPNPRKLQDPITIQLRAADLKVQQANDAFAFELVSRVYDEEMANNKKNFMVSPFSLSMALGMTWNGADKETKEAMKNAMKFNDSSDDEVNAYFQKMMSALLKTDPSTKLAIANSIWTNKSVSIKQPFLDINKKYYAAQIESVDFSNPNTVNRINNWCAEQTNNLIKKVLRETDSDALMYLLNALYFKGIWASQFKKSETASMPFTTFAQEEKRVDMMHQKHMFKYASDENIETVALPYGNNAFSMMVLLPKEGKTIKSALEKLMTPNYWSDMKNRLNTYDVKLYLPKFKTEYSKRLNFALTDMGMGVAFTSNANFSKMSDKESQISFVDQFTYIQTDEVGTEAAAVTVVGMELTAPPPPKSVVFKADRPFLYLIQENSTGAILFMGLVHDVQS